MSINNEIQSKSLIEQQQRKEILIPSHNNIFHFINPYQLANFGLFMWGYDGSPDDLFGFKSINCDFILLFRKFFIPIIQILF